MKCNQPTDRKNSVDPVIGRRLSHLMETGKMAREELGLRLAVSPDTIDEYCTGSKRIGAATLFELSRIFGVRLECFFENFESH